ncbi:MAG TPA: hypothetical protein VM470_09440 [Acidimicrobiia bacterium]|nr:hypothetical protein [Acidimicrobiia bacterium]
MTVEVRNPRAEALALVPRGYGALVLEPSPPAIHEGEYSDDPTSLASFPLGTRVVSPVSGGDTTWEDFVADQPHLHRWAQDRWLGPWHRLQTLPAGFAETRDILHQIAYFVLSPVRHRANTKIGLRFTMGGFGTPFFGEDAQARLEGSSLVVQRGHGVERFPVTTIGAACEAMRIEYRPHWFPPFRDQLPPADPDTALKVDEEAVAAIAAVFGFGCGVLAELRTEVPERDRPSLVQIWPEHFDIAIELGDPEAGNRASYGFSPGDHHHPEPYLYVSAWGAIDRTNPVWNDPHFNGASLPYSDLLASDDQRSTAFEFFHTARALLAI